ncbi:fatty acid synthase, partial [Nephila pilipes]
RSIHIDTACSSGLVALNLAVQSIQRGEMEAAVVGGVNLCLRPGSSVQFHKLGALSHDSTCRSFDADAKGYVRSEAIATLFVQKSDAARRKYATIVNIKTNIDGYKDKGITFPSSEMQKRLLEEVYQECKLSPLKVSYVEAHGTGTVAGDPVELVAIADVFCPGREEPLWVGSVKSNMGHAEPVSGLCGVLKILISMENGVLPPNLHYYKPNPAIPALISDQIKIPIDCTPWKADYAAASSFGLGGVNAHVVLKSNGDGTKRPQNSEIPQLVLYSGRTQDSVRYLFEYLQICAKEQKIPGVLSREFFALLHKSVHSSCKLKPYRGYKLLVNDGEIAEIKV